MASPITGIDPQTLAQLQQYLQAFAPSEEDKKQARALGLLGFGLSLAGARRGYELPALGNAGLLGISAYRNELSDLARQRQQNMGAAMQLAQMARRLGAPGMLDQPYGDAGAAPAPAAPPAPAAASGYGPGVSASFGLPYTPSAPGTPTSSPAPAVSNTTQRTLRQRLQAMNVPNEAIQLALTQDDPNKALLDLVTQYSKPVAVGNLLYGNGRILGGAVAKDTVPVTSGPNGLTMQPIPGLQDYLARGAGMEEGAKRQATSQYELVDVPIGGGQTRKMTLADATKLLGGQAPAAPTGRPDIAPTLSAADRALAQRDYAATGGGAPTWPAPQPGALPQVNLGGGGGGSMGGFGVSPSPLAIKGAEEAILTDAAARRAVNEKAIGQIDTSYGTASTAATQGIPLVREARSMIDSGKVNTGALAPFQTEFGRWLSAAGIQSAKDEVSNTQAFASTQARQVLTIIKSLGSGSGISDADREYAAKIVGGDIKLDAGAVRRLLDISERVQLAQIAAHNRRVDAASGAMNNPSLRTLYGVDVPQGGLPALQSQGATPTAPAGPLQKNTTATYKAQQAIKAGADPAAVRQRLIDQGYDPGGL